MKNRHTDLASLARDLPGICIILQSTAAVALTAFLTWLFITSEVL